MDRSEYDEARKILKILMGPTFHTGVRSNARKLLEQVDDIDTKRQAVYRKVREGETRSEGRLERIDCTGPGVSFHVLTRDRLLRFWAPDLTQVAFITLREDRVGMVTCGRRDDPENVYVTWRRHDASDGRVVAIEFLAR